jgi:hypothetical protein
VQAFEKIIATCCSTVFTRQLAVFKAKQEMTLHRVRPNELACDHEKSKRMDNCFLVRVVIPGPSAAVSGNEEPG